MNARYRSSYCFAGGVNNWPLKGETAGTCMAMKARPTFRWQELHPAVSSLNAFANFALSLASSVAERASVSRS
jgi:hypothetical protein